MNYETFLNLGLDLDDKAIPHLQIAPGTDMGPTGFAINKHVFTQQFIFAGDRLRT